MDFLTLTHILKLENDGHAVTIYPRKHIVCVNGFKYYKISAGTLNRWKYYKKYGVVVG